MRITKFGHCCLLIEEGSLRILTDPGNYNVTPDTEHIDIVLITHEHADHCHIDSLKAILARNAGAEVISHVAVAQLLAKENIACTTITDGESIERKGVRLSSYGVTHDEIYPGIPVCQNTGFLIAEKFYYPGDSFHNPGKPVDVLAVPVAGPWIKLADAIDFAREIKPRVAFPVHDGMLRDNALGSTRLFPQKVLEPLGVTFVDLPLGTPQEF